MEAFGKSNGDWPITVLERSRKTFFQKTLSSFLTEKVETTRVIKKFLRNLILIF